MGAIVLSTRLGATLTRYWVPGWGAGELWTSSGVVLAHDFDFADEPPNFRGDRGTFAHARTPPKGAVSPPVGTLRQKSSRVGHAFAPTSCQDTVVGHATAQALPSRIARYLAGDDVPLRDVELDLSWATTFQRAVAEALRDVPRGDVVTYGELAALAGYPGAARAAGSFCAGNRFALLVPCHRVVSATGIGGYGATGVGVKRRLLALEGVVV